MTDLVEPDPAQGVPEYLVHCHGDRPYFAELPYYLWGAAKYASSGDAHFPTDREWRELGLVNRETGAVLDVTPVPGTGRRVILAVLAPDPAVALRAAYFLTWRTDGQTTPRGATTVATYGDLAPQITGWDLGAAIARSVRVRKTFGRAELLPFDDLAFWPSWKWIGVPPVARKRVGRWIMDSVLRRDPRAVYLCIEWLRHGTAQPIQTAALLYALQYFTGRELATAAEWLAWYKREGAAAYPRPDFATWWLDVEHE